MATMTGDALHARQQEQFRQMTLLMRRRSLRYRSLSALLVANPSAYDELVREVRPIMEDLDRRVDWHTVEPVPGSVPA